MHGKSLKVVSDDAGLDRYERRHTVAHRLFQANASTWFFVNLLCIGIWAAVGGGYFWPVWVLMPWGILLAFQAKLTYGNWGR
jgi:1,4-dihydroxy-2-naphthoate octaprenyltransferase